jgi:hypothetical protein
MLPLTLPSPPPGRGIQNSLPSEGPLSPLGRG